MIRDREYWLTNCHKSSEQLARETGTDGGSMRRRIRAAKAAYPDLPWGAQEPKKPQTGIAIYDLHHPSHDKRLWSNILRYIKDTNPDVIVFGGDNQDFQTISHWIANKRRQIEGMRIKQDYAECNRDVVDPVNSLLKSDARKIWLKGNHEDWVEQYIDEHPEVEGYLELENNLHLEGWEVYEYGTVAEVGKLKFTHGHYTNLHNAYKTAQTYGASVVYGHGHSFQAFTLTSPLGCDTHMGIQLPCACHLNPHYRQNQPNSWVNGFGTFYVQPNGYWNLYPTIAFDGAFAAPNGKLYK